MSDIMQAISEDNYLQIKKLIKDGTNVNEIIENEDNENDECLMYYALHKKCSFETLKYMVENGYDLKFVDSQGVSILDEAIVLGNVEFIEYLICEQKIDVNKTERKSGLTPVIQATCYGKIDLVKLLISYGADLSIKDKFSLSAADYARKLQRKQMQEFLENLA